MALALNQPYFRDIYFADASRRAAHTLIQNLGGNTGGILTTAKNDTLRADYPK
jgi:hypothetical protein